MVDSTRTAVFEIKPETKFMKICESVVKLGEVFPGWFIWKYVPLHKKLSDMCKKAVFHNSGYYIPLINFYVYLQYVDRSLGKKNCVC